MTDSIVRILIADDNEVVRSILRAVIVGHEGWVISGEAASGWEAVEKAILFQPNVVLVDISMPGLGGLAVSASIQKSVPNAKILIVTEHDPGILKFLAAQPGVSGCVSKSRIMQDLIPAVETALKSHSSGCSLFSSASV
jgi:DNA-binding NarL/FixJ family response regulator